MDALAKARHIALEEDGEEEEEEEPVNMEVEHKSRHQRKRKTANRYKVPSHNCRFKVSGADAVV